MGAGPKNFDGDRFAWLGGSKPAFDFVAILGDPPIKGKDQIARSNPGTIGRTSWDDRLQWGGRPVQANLLQERRLVGPDLAGELHASMAWAVRP